MFAKNIVTEAEETSFLVPTLVRELRKPYIMQIPNTLY